MSKHSKILNSEHKGLINAMIRDGLSSREISRILNEHGFEISHTAISSYSVDHSQEVVDEQETVNGIDMNRIYINAKTMDWQERNKLIGEIRNTALLMVREKLKNSTLTTKDIDQARKLVDLAKNAST